MNSPRWEALEAQRAMVLRQQAELAFQADYLTELEKGLDQASRELLPVVIAAEGDVVEIRNSPIQAIILALITGLIVAMPVALVVEQWPRWQTELAAHDTQNQSSSE